MTQMNMQTISELLLELRSDLCEDKTFDVLLEHTHNSVVFIDEGSQFAASDEFAGAVKGSDNYYVIVTRDHLPNLPYSVEEIYGIKTSGKYGRL